MEAKVEFLTESRDQYHKENQTTLQQIANDVAQMNIYMNGQGPELPGFKIMLDRHTQDIQLFKWMFGIVITVGLGLLMTQIWNIVMKS